MRIRCHWNVFNEPLPTIDRCLQSHRIVMGLYATVLSSVYSSGTYITGREKGGKGTVFWSVTQRNNVEVCRSFRRINRLHRQCRREK
jgi:hypothetical protein